MFVFTENLIQASQLCQKEELKVMRTKLKDPFLFYSFLHIYYSGPVVIVVDQLKNKYFKNDS